MADATIEVAFLKPKERADLPQFEELFKGFEGFMGYVPNTLLIMGHRPEILEAFVPLVFSIFRSGLLERGLKQMVAQMASATVACAYCEAHTAELAHDNGGIDAVKVASVCRFEDSDLFTEAERCALRFARDAASHPSQVGPAHFEALSQWYTDAEVTELVATISLFGFLTCWNTTCATELEPAAFDFATQHLGPRGWQPGRHRPRPSRERVC